MTQRIVLTFLIFLFCVNAAIGQQETDTAAMTLIQQAQKLYQEGNKKGAATAFEKALQYKLDPKAESFVRSILGYMLIHESKALPLLLRARELDPDNLDVLLYLGQYSFKRQEFSKAREYVNAYLTAAPNGANAPAARQTLTRIDEEAGADDLVNKINAGFDAINAGSWPEAVAILSETSRQDPHPYTEREQILLGQAYLHLRKYAQAIEAVNKSLAINRNEVLNWNSLGTAYAASGDMKKFRETLDVVLTLNPTESQARSARDSIEKLDLIMKIDDPNAENYLKAASHPYFVKWPSSRMPLKVYIAKGDSVPTYQPYYETCVTESLDAWAKATEGKFSWVRTEDKKQANLEIGWSGNEKDFVNEDGVCLNNYLRKPSQPKGIVDHSKITYLTNHKGQPIAEPALWRTAAHEIGHALGIQEHSSNYYDVMYYAQAGYAPPDKKLSARDIATIKAIYDTAD